jgi:hypothetical protein
MSASGAEDITFASESEFELLSSGSEPVHPRVETTRMIMTSSPANLSPEILLVNRIIDLRVLFPLRYFKIFLDYLG